MRTHTFKQTMPSHYLELYEDADSGNEIIFEDTDEGLEQAKSAFRNAFYTRVLHYYYDANGRIITTLDEFVEFYKSLGHVRSPYLEISRHAFGTNHNERGYLVYDIDDFIQDETEEE